MKINIKYTCWLLVLQIFFLGSCRDAEDAPEPVGSEYFVSATSIGTIPQAVLKVLAVTSGFEEFSHLIENDVAFYKIIYNTTFKENKIEASGLLAIPLHTAAPPALLSAQHGTIFKDADAPSNFPAAFTGFEIAAATGFVTAIPDYIGYGVSKDIVPPHYDQEHAATAVVDMLKAVKYYLQKQQITINSNLFLVGYSEGGYVTMAAQKEIETNPEHNLSLTAVAAGAGGYDLPVMLDKVATAQTYTYPAFLAAIMQSYNATYNWSRPLTDFFQEPYATNIPILLNGTKDSDEINRELPARPADLFTPAFYANLQNTEEETAFKRALVQNSFLDWLPQSPTRLYHGSADETIFYETTLTTFNRFEADGATNVELITIEGGMHRNSISPMMQDVLPWFRSLK